MGGHPMFFKMLLMATGMATASYDLLAINLSLLVLRRLYDLHSWESSIISTSALVGMMIGQLFFGRIADRIGRRASAVATCCLLIVGAIGSSLAYEFFGMPLILFLMISAWRFLIGIGIGGEYPVTAIFTSESSSEQPEAAGPSKGATAAATAAAVAAATEAATSEIVLEHITHTPKNDTIVSEDAITVTVESSEQGSAAPAPSEPAPSTRAAAPQYVFWTRGKCIAAVFASQGLGNLAASVAMLLILLTMPRDHLDWSWRLALFLGAVPAMFILIPRFRLRESAAFLKAEAADSDGIKAAHVPARSALAVFKTYWSQLLGTAGSWFLLDIVFYGNSLFASTLIDMAGVASHEWEGVLQNVAMNVFIALLALPGYWTAVFLIDLVGRRRLQIGGFVLMATVYITMGLCFDIIKQYPIMFISLYGLSYFFANAGPNSTTFIVPTELFPVSIRSTCHGLSAASGKAGAFVGAAIMHPVLEAAGVGTTLVLCGIVAIMGMMLSVFFVPETRDIDLDALDQYEMSLRVSEAPPVAVQLELSVVEQ